MRDLFLVASHEFWTLIKDRRFLFFSLGMPLLFVVAAAIPLLIELAKGKATVAYLDQAAIVRPLPPPTDKKEEPEVIYALLADEAAGRMGVEEGRYRSFWIIPADYPQTGRLEVVVRGDLSETDESAMRDLLRGSLLGDVGPARVTRLNDPMSMSYRVLDQGRAVKQGIELLFALAVPFLMAFAFPITISFSSGILASAIASEKENRMIEVLVTSTHPWALIGGKILGLGGVALAQIALWAGGLLLAGLLFLLGGKLPNGLPIPWDLLAWALPFFLLGYLFCAGLMVGIGIVVGETRAAQQAAGFLSLLTFIPLWGLAVILDQPDGLLARLLTYLPFTTPVLVPLRLALGNISIGELGLALLLNLLIVALLIWLMGQLFRVMMLRFGGAPSLGQLLGRRSRRSQR